MAKITKRKTATLTAVRRNEPRCVICGKAKDGIGIQEDQVLGLLRWFKRNVTRNEKGYKLVVCKSCYPIYTKSRKRFVNRQVLYVGLGVILSLLLVIGGANKLLAVLYSVVVIVFMYALSLLSYMPALKVKAQLQKSAR